MIAIPKKRRSQTSAPAWQDKFVNELLPGILAHARFRFLHLSPEARDEAIQAVVCHCCAAVARLAELDKLDLAYPYALANYAVAQIKEGRGLGQSLNCKDVSSEYCQRRKCVDMKRLDRYNEVKECWLEVLVQDKNCTPAELAATRIDFAAWLKTLKPRTRKIARYLSVGNKTSDTAEKFGMSWSRVSQLRQELKVAWEAFVGENAACAQ